MRHCRPSAALVGLCCTQETTSGAVPAQQYANCSEEPTVKASASSPYSHEPAPCSDSHQLPRQCGKQGPRVGALHRASGHAARPKDTSANFRQPSGRTPALQLTGLHNH